MEIEFKSLNELYQRLKPALKTKAKEMQRNGYEYIKEEDIWNYLKEIRWKNGYNLELCQMVDDIINTEDIIIDGYLKGKLNLNHRHIYFDNIEGGMDEKEVNME